MGATKPEKADKKERKEKKDKKRSEADGVSKSSSSKKDKKEKKEKKEKLKNAVSTALDAQQENGGGDVTTLAIIKADKDDDNTKTATVLKPVVGALVPFARPLADEKGTKKIMKSVRKGMYSHSPPPPRLSIVTPIYYIPIFPPIHYRRKSPATIQLPSMIVILHSEKQKHAPLRFHHRYISPIPGPLHYQEPKLTLVSQNSGEAQDSQARRERGSEVTAEVAGSGPAQHGLVPGGGGAGGGHQSRGRDQPHSGAMRGRERAVHLRRVARRARRRRLHEAAYQRRHGH